ncbi:MAG TPA: F0F1 ATP synthase subunit A [Bryobacteraceae bacterium]|nr:F0F1 ATP synthase subunit A [Bryobacteraceae bacterium]
MHEHELWVTALFNDHLAGVANGILTAVGLPAQTRPWANYITMELVVAAFIIVLFGMLKPKLSMASPGGLQHAMEGVHGFLTDTAHDNIHHGHRKFVPFVGTLFFFVLFANLIGIIPTFESPTMFPPVPAGLALAAFLYYNIKGFGEGGIGYLKQFMGPDMGFPSFGKIAMALLMIPIEIVSHMARPISLTIRLFANMFAGEQVTLVFLGLTYIGVPVIFFGLHVFVSFVQAFVFALLTTIYVGSAVSHEH